MIAILETSPTQFHKAFLMARAKIDPKAFGINLPKAEFVDAMVNAFNDTYHGQLTFDELLLHPQEAATFCADVRRRYGYYYLPDDIILRAIMGRRKRP